MDISVKCENRSIPSVDVDRVAISRLVVNHFADRGYRHLALAMPWWEIDEPRKCYLPMIKEMAKRRSLKWTKSWPESKHYDRNDRFLLPETYINDLRELPRPLGVFVTMDTQAAAIAYAAREIGLRIPDDVAIVSAGNDTDICETAVVPLSSVAIPFERIGWEAAHILNQSFQGNIIAGQDCLVTPSRIHVRQSSDYTAVDQPLVSAALRFISENAHRNIGVAEVVDALRTHRATLNRHFREHLDATVLERIHRAKIQLARNQLLNTAAPLDDVALLSGFRNASHLCRVFIKSEKMSPIAYRKSHKMLP